jgi:cytochrome c-type biogenesis protein CcmH
LGGVGLYANLGSPEMPSVASVSPPAASQTTADAPATAAAIAGQVEGMITKLQARLQANPKDAEGWRMLGWAQFNTQHFAASAEAYAKALELDPANVDYKSAYAESLVQSAEGVVTPKAQALIADVLAKDPKDYRSLFYDALAHEQAGDQNGALDRWMNLLAAAPTDANWRDDVKQRVINLGKATGRDVAAATTLPKLDSAAPKKPLASAVPPTASAPQITEEQKAAVQALPAEDQLVMIKGMVAKLAEKLKANPVDPDGWIKLIRSYQVLNDGTAAKDALAQALTAFENDPVNKSKIVAAADELGVK